ncbi:MAG: DUF2752 domain-containing protein [Holophagales bacterium]|nr:DUF2752 domain-containing protein [Holophagales bacterium]
MPRSEFSTHDQPPAPGRAPAGGQHGRPAALAGTGGSRRLGPPWALAWLGTCVALVLAAPLAPAIAGLLFCPWKELAGFACPLCCTTRAALALAELRPLFALATYPLPTLAWVAFFLGGLVYGTQAIAGRDPSSVERAWRELRQRFGRRRLWAVLVVAVLANWAYSIATGV